MRLETRYGLPGVGGGLPPAGLRRVRFLLACVGGVLAALTWAGDSVEERVRAVLATGEFQGEGTNGPPLRVRVIEGRAAVYASTNASREAVAWLSSGSELSVRGELPDDSVWVCVDPPEAASVWIYRELVRDGTVVSDKSRLRSGAGLSHRTVGSLDKGARVDVRGRYGDWLRIKPPAGLGFWVLRDQVEPFAVMPEGGVWAESEPAVEPAEELTTPDTNRVSEVAARVETNLTAALPRALPPRPLPAELAGAALADVPGQGAQVLLTGVLDWGTVGGFAAPFCLVGQQAGGETTPVCHVFAPASAASPNVGARVALEGSRWQVKGVALPVLVVQRLRPLE